MLPTRSKKDSLTSKMLFEQGDLFNRCELLTQAEW